MAKTLYKSDLVTFVKKEYERRREERLPYELQWQLNSNFLSGNQYCYIDDISRTISPTRKVYWWQEQKVYNQIAPIYETRLAKLGRINPSLMTRPSSQSRRDIQTSKVCTAVAKGTYQEVEMDEKIRYANLWSELTGNAFYYHPWDPDKGKLLGSLEEEKIYEGGIEEEILSPYEIYPFSNSDENLETTRSLLRVKAYHVDEVKETWGIKVKGEELDVYSLSNNIGNGAVFGFGTSTMKIVRKKKKDQCLVYYFYELPSGEYPSGRMIIVADKQLAHYGILPYKVGKNREVGYPISMQVCLKRAGQFWGESVITRLIPVQQEYNDLKNRKSEYRRRCAIGVMTYQDGSVDEDDIEENGFAPGSSIPYQRGSTPPRFMDNPALPSQFDKDEKKLEDLFVTISGVSTFASQSVTPTGVTSGSAMEIIQEQDNTRLSLSADNIRAAVKRCGKHWLRLNKQYAKNKRTLKYLNEDDNTAIVSYDRSDITTDDVIFETENELNNTPAQRRSMLTQLLQYGFFNSQAAISPRDKTRILEMLQLGNWEATADIEQAHVARANRENQELENNILPQIFQYDDDGIHLQEHIKYMLSADFKEASQQNPQMFMVMKAHLKQHEISMQYKTAQTAQQAANA